MLKGETWKIGIVPAWLGWLAAILLPLCLPNVFCAHRPSPGGQRTSCMETEPSCALGFVWSPRVYVCQGKEGQVGAIWPRGGVPVHGKGLEQGELEAPFQPRALCGSVSLWLYLGRTTLKDILDFLLSVLQLFHETSFYPLLLAALAGIYRWRSIGSTEHNNTKPVTSAIAILFPSADLG